MFMSMIVFSVFYSVVHGVPHGNSLVPLFLIIFIFDMGNAPENKMISYTDDTTL